MAETLKNLLSVGPNFELIEVPCSRSGIYLKGLAGANTASLRRLCSILAVSIYCTKLDIHRPFVSRDMFDVSLHGGEYGFLNVLTQKLNLGFLYA